MLALDSLSADTPLLKLAHYLVLACEEVNAEGKTPETDPAVAIIAARIGFASPADCMSSDSWNQLVHAVAHQADAKIELKANAKQ